MAIFGAVVENAYSMSLILHMGLLSIPWCQVRIEPPMPSFTVMACTVSKDVPVAAEIPSGMTSMDWFRMMSTKFALNVVQVELVYSSSG